MSDENAARYFEAGEACLKILPQVVAEWRSEYGKSGIPPIIPPRDELREIYMRFGRWDDAARVVRTVAEAGLYTKAEEKNALGWIAGCKAAATAALELIAKEPGILQKDLYDVLPYIDRECLKWFLRASYQIDKVKAGNTNRLFLRGQVPPDVVPTMPEPSLLVKAALNLPQPDIKFPDWYISLSFGPSSSSSYLQAVALAKMAPIYLEHVIEGNVLHQAVYSDAPREYLQFVQLYELVKDWKAHFVVINGQITDRKIISGLNLCYGDRCRSGDERFCYGASDATENPFGCHRLLTHASNHPWWTFGYFDENRVWHVDKETIQKRLTENAKLYRQCPAFSWDRVIAGLRDLPEVIDPNEDPRWIRDGDRLVRNNTETVNLVVSVSAGPQPSGRKLQINPDRVESTTAAGCAVSLAAMVLGALLFALVIW